VRSSKAPDRAQARSFTLVLSGLRDVTDQVTDALFEAGCDDALVGSQHGNVFLDFDREASSFREAVLSAIAAVEGAGIGAQVVRVEPDELVTMAEIARRSRRSRESIRQLVAGLRGPGDFPPPVANLKQQSPIWRWTDVERWLRDRLGGEARPLATEAGAGVQTAAINAALEVRRHTKDAREARQLIEALIVAHHGG
jgi:hypothetical protein